MVELGDMLTVIVGAVGIKSSSVWGNAIPICQKSSILDKVDLKHLYNS